MRETPVLQPSVTQAMIQSRASRYFACDSHAHLVSQTGSVISNKSPSPVFKWSGI